MSKFLFLSCKLCRLNSFIVSKPMSLKGLWFSKTSVLSVKVWNDRRIFFFLYCCNFISRINSFLYSRVFIVWWIKLPRSTHYYRKFILSLWTFRKIYPCLFVFGIFLWQPKKRICKKQTLNFYTIIKTDKVKNTTMTAKKNATLQISQQQNLNSHYHYSTCSRDTEMFCQAWFL